MQDGFDVSKHRKYEIRSGKLKQQEAKIRSAQQKLSNLNKRYSLDGMRFCNASMPYPHSFLSRKHFDGAVIDMTNDERKGRTKCTFLGATCPTEAVEHALVANYLIPDDSVLEVKKIVCTFADTVHFSSHVFLLFNTNF